MKITRFEDLECWQEARKLVKMVYDAINANKRLAADLRFSGQFSSAAVSTMSNIAEGFSRETDKEFLRGLWISKGSAAEVKSLSYSALDQGYLTEEQREAIYDQAEKVASLNSGMIKYLQKSSSTLKNKRTFRRKDSTTEKCKDSTTQRPKDALTQRLNNPATQ